MNVAIRIYILCVLVILLAGAFTQAPVTGTINVEITGLHSDKGEVGIALYNDKKAFPVDPLKSVKQVRVKITGGKCATSFTGLPYGEYAVSAYHDENNDGALNFNIFHIPKEGVSASNNAKGHFGPPLWDDAKFKLDSASININMKMAY